MKKVLLWIIGLIAAVIVAYGISQWLIGRSDGGYSLRELLNSAQDQKCVFSEQTDAAESRSLVYTTAGKLRSHFISTTTEQTISAHVLLDNDYMYTWLDGFNLGLKTPLQGRPDGAENGLNLDKKLDYRCEPWAFPYPAAKVAAFTLPSAIQFTELKR